MQSRLKKGGFMSNSFFLFFFVVNIILSCILGDSGEIFWVIYKFVSSAKCHVNIPQLDLWFMYNTLHIAGSHFSCILIFYVEVVSVVLYADNPVTSSPL